MSDTEFPLSKTVLLYELEDKVERQREMIVMLYARQFVIGFVALLALAAAIVAVLS